MLKTMAIVRTVFLVFVIGFTLRGLPLFWQVARTFDEQYSRCAANLKIVTAGAWLAIIWIAIETVVGWLVARRARPAGPETPPPKA
jgi:hypothetical protein